MDCQGPCLKHCCKKTKIIYLIIGVLIGILLYELFNKKKLTTK
jgi:hypothetical protein